MTHISYLFNGFVWLDHIDIESKAAILPIEKILTAANSSYAQTSFYRPVVTIFHSLDYFIYDRYAPGYHLTNLFLHLAAALASTVFIYQFIKLTTKEILIITSWVGLHSASWSTVGIISNRPDLLSTLFSMLAIIFYSKSRLLLMVLFCLLAFGSKETSFWIIPLGIIIFEIKNNFKLQTRTWLAGITTIGFVISRHSILGFNWKLTYPDWPIATHLGTRLSLIPKYLIGLFFPWPTPFADTVKLESTNSFSAIAGIIMIIIFIFLLRKYWKNAEIQIGLLLVAGSLLPGLNLIPLPRFYSNNYVYFSIIAAGILIILLCRKYSHKPLLFILIIFSFITFVQGTYLKSDKTLFTREVEKNPYYSEGWFYLKKYDLALEKNSQYYSYLDHAAAINNLAGVYLSQNNLDAADNLLVQLPITETVAYNRAVIAAQKNNCQLAIAFLKPYLSSSKNSNLLALNNYCLNK